MFIDARNQMFHLFTKRLQPQKKRSDRFLVPTSGRGLANSWFYAWVQIIAQGRGLVSWRLVERFFIWGKRLVRYPRQHARFWVNLQCNLVFTRKAKNTRMGKGKGGYAGRLTRVRAGALIFALSSVRAGYLIRLLRQMRVRCPLCLGVSFPQTWGCKRPSWLRHRRTRRRYARLASARAWGKTRKYRRQRIFEFITLTFF